jgi:two-component system, cell cycle response regulator CpdR
MARILVAEDDSSMRRFLCQALERAGHAVHTVGDGREALQALEQGGYDLLLTDVAMPGVDGVELAKCAASRSPSMQVMFITGFAAVALKMGQTANGNCAPVMSRPFHLRQLAQHVEVVLSA